MVQFMTAFVMLLGAVSTARAADCDTVLKMDFNEGGEVTREKLRSHLSSSNWLSFLKNNLFGSDFSRAEFDNGTLKVKHPKGVLL
jgi:hypothetical protein